MLSSSTIFSSQTIPFFFSSQTQVHMCLSTSSLLGVSKKFLGQTMHALGNQILRNPIKVHIRRSSRLSSISGNPDTDPITPPRTYQVVVAATKDMGIGKEGKLPWKLPGDLKFFKHITTTTLDPTKMNAVIMGRKTWESVPPQFRPLPARLNVLLTRSCLSLDNAYSGNSVVVCGSVGSALQSLALPPYCQSIEKVFVIGGGEVLRESLNAPECDAIHITEIETSVDCDTFIPAIDKSSFRPWYSSQPLVENDVRYSFATYVRSESDKFGVNSFEYLPRKVYESHEEYIYLRLLRDIVSSSSPKDDKLGNDYLSRSCCEMQFNLRRSFPLLTTKRVSWDQVIEELFRLIGGFSKEKFSDIIDKIKNQPRDKPTSLSAENPSDLMLEFYVANGELSCQTYQPFADMLLSVPLSIASYALLTCTIAHLCGFVAGSFTYKLGEARVYNINTVQEQIHKLPKPFPILKIHPRKKDINTLVPEDFELVGYDPCLD